MAQHKYAHMPEILQEIANIAGIEATEAIMRSFGGRNIYIPGHIARAQWMVELCGEAAARKLIDHFTFDGRGATYLIPMGERATKQKKLAEYLKQGLSPPAAAKRAGVHMRTAYRARKNIKDDRQLDVEDFLVAK
ncbi:helix-turn-helix domain-containing protein [Candidatus Tokpelaia sp.]|uniref:helix-turn-helix domain-containing protein n=1 Tax=Candidatus Tokpelaia sp. TaxID=2233777 RepID=UPI00123878F3|nr:helix-turn-helix domain-containing protein [Candidatus Tokpelaia sp.]KAA6405045.1 helix-turn-helix domain-containing protein [Candidatus Tokpelaia sp.]